MPQYRVQSYRYWYFAVSRCEKGPIDFKYTLEMLNHGSFINYFFYCYLCIYLHAFKCTGDYWQEQFSYEDQGNPQS